MKTHITTISLCDYNTNYGTEYNPAYDFGFIFEEEEETLDLDLEFIVVPQMPPSSGNA